MTVTVLLADDHAVVRDGLRYLLEANPDIRVVGHAEDGRQAVELVERLRPDVVVMDIAMPGLNGIEATRIIVKNSPSIRVVILSMHSTEEHVNRSLKAGASGFLLKESAGPEVVEAVRSVHAGHRYLSQKVSDWLIDSYVSRQLETRQGNQIERLSHRELEVLQLVVEGSSSVEIASILGLSPKTVDTYRSRIMTKLDIHDMAGLVKFAIQQGLTALE